MVFVSIFKGMNRPTLKHAIHNQLPTSLDDEATEVETASLYNQRIFLIDVTMFGS
jgi:hypothetical protein